MNPRERILALCIVTAMILGGGGLLVNSLVLGPLAERETMIQSLNKEIQTKQERKNQVEAERYKLNRARLLSLPPDEGLASREYEKHLAQMLTDSGFQAGEGATATAMPVDRKSSPAVGGKPIYIRLPFTILARGNLESLVQFLENFYASPLVQQVTDLTIRRPVTNVPQQGQGQPIQNVLEIKLQVEALIITGADPRTELLPQPDRRLMVLDLVAGLTKMPVGLAVAPWAVGPAGPLGPGLLAVPARNYELIASKNIFYGLPNSGAVAMDDADPRKYVRLVSIIENPRRVEAVLYSPFDNSFSRLRAEPGFDSFQVRNEEGDPLVKGKVVKIGNRDVVFKVDGEYHSIHVGENILEATRKRLTSSELKELGVVSAPKKESRLDE